jgi:hypothetical protein
MPLIHSTTDKARSKNIETLINDGYPRKQAVAIAYRVQRHEMERRHAHTPRRRAAENPSGSILVIGAGVALLGVAAYFMLRKPAAAAPTPQVAATSAPPQLPPASSAIIYTDPVSGTGYTLAQACANAQTLTRIGHPTEAAVWANICRAHGGTV